MLNKLNWLPRSGPKLLELFKAVLQSIALALLCLTATAQSPALQFGVSDPQPIVSPTTNRIAEVLGIEDSFLKLATIGGDCERPMELLLLRQALTASALAASLDVQSVVAEIDYERAQILELRMVLSGYRDRKINWLTLANIATGSGSGVAATALQFSDRTANLGNAIGIAGGAVGVVSSLLALKQTGGTGSLGVAPNMLAPLFNRKSELRSVYPASVWTYLNTAPYADPRFKTSWRAELLDEWSQLGRINRAETVAANQKIDQLTSRIGEARKLSIDVLMDRSAMLGDLRARISLMNSDLRNLVKDIHSRPTCPGLRAWN